VKTSTTQTLVMFFLMTIRHLQMWFVGSFGVLGPQNYLSIGPTTYPANQNFTVYLMQQIDTSRGVILADN